MESIAKELDYELKWMKNSEDSGLKHPHTSLKDHSVLAVRCGAETQSIQ